MHDFFIATAGNCRGSSTGTMAPDAVYQTTIPANTALTVTLNALFDSTLNVVAAPQSNCGTGGGTGMVCLGGADVISGPEITTVTNSGTTPLDVFIIIDGWTTTEQGGFDLQTSTAAVSPGYTKTTIAAACRTLGAPTALLSSSTAPVISDDAVSATTALPMPFTFFNQAVTHFSVNNNGLLQFFTSASGTGSNAYSNVSIPDPATPNGFATAFWDDLYPAATTTIRYETSGATPNRVVTVEWFDAAPYAAGAAGPERLTFQVQLYETSNVVEFHYCNLAANTGSMNTVTGAGASIGIESLAGNSGTQHSVNTALSISTANALRFTP
jgi:hypothetical protein